MCPWAGRSRREQQRPYRAQTWCVWAFCASQEQGGWPWGQTAALGTVAQAGVVSGGHSGCPQWPGAAWQPQDRDPCRAGSAQGQERGNEAESRVTAGTWGPWLGQGQPQRQGSACEIHPCSAMHCSFTPLLLTASFFHLSALGVCYNSC